MPIRTNAEELAAKLDTASGRVGPVGTRAIRQAADEVLKVQEAHVPVRTGRLRGSLNVQVEGDGRSGTIIAHVGPTGVRYATFQEHGTSRMAAHPFAEPATEEARRILPQLVEHAAEEIARDV